ncbi:phosphate ABC transporter substrate-binding protein PstS [Roseimaritima ulvae]|uniref:Phosphate-binding protein n=1 Tax=Roseimaritima ulvae TaxID=980254 RepID=A0A5B9QMM2_9BACT|nr:phosphate ABC transporter substrate-binding protein PstS [Roseimaritima ulvae]QEG39112.1 Phosphate-binding protein PstS precursor [Roseimaritima ulvae]
MEISKTVAIGALFALVVAFTSGCADSHSGAKGLTVTGGGSTFAAPLIAKWADEYYQRNPDFSVEYAAVGSGDGEEGFLNGTEDFGATDAGLSTADLAQAEGGALQVPITAGIIVLAYNPDGLPADLKLPRAVYVDAFLGKGTRWNDPRIAEANPGQSLPDEPIKIVVREDSSGTTFAFTNHLANLSQEWADAYGSSEATSDLDRGVKDLHWPDNASRCGGNSGVAVKIKQTQYSLGYVQYGAARDANISMAALENKAGNYVPPTGTSGLETLLNAELTDGLRAYIPDPEGEYSYPIVTFTWLLLRKEYEDETKTAQIKAFAEWCLNQGQDYAEAAGNVRLAPHVVRAAEAELTSMQSATEAPLSQSP